MKWHWKGLGPMLCAAEEQGDLEMQIQLLRSSLPFSGFFSLESLQMLRLYGRPCQAKPAYRWVVPPETSKLCKTCAVEKNGMEFSVVLKLELDVVAQIDLA
eukprot:s3688_g9.t1